MLALSLGMAWLLLAPLSLWLLLRGTTTERAGAILTLALLEAGTIAMNTLPQPAGPLRPATAAARALPAPPCADLAPAPESARIGEELVLSWKADPHECGTAEVVLRAHGDRLLIWLYEGRRAGRHRTAFGWRQQDVHTLPVRVGDGRASLRVPLPGKAGFIPTDGRTGRRIPEPAP
ncbi:hypothetical protein [Nonomuraea sp. NPDC050643]|uniref:hypothetical protein n=1 Tax=Nonomuraea sp. NPDC050643 TaxID=3155660 RepID=UPI0034091B23